MEACQIGSPTELNNFLAQRQKETLAIAQLSTQKIVETENSLMDFEILLSSDLDKKSREKLTSESKKLREEYWQELEERNGSDYNKIMDELNAF